MDNTQKVKINEVRKHLSYAQIDSAIQLLNEILRDDPSLGDLVIKSLKGSNIGKIYKDGNVDIDPNVKNIEINSIVRGLLILLDDIEKNNIIREKIFEFTIDLKYFKSRDFTLLLMGRTGVGKSSTINSLIGYPIAAVSDYMPKTKEIEEYRLPIEGTNFLVIDTPGLCDDVPEKGNDEKYMHLVQEKINKIDILLYVTNIDETRVRSDERHAIKIMTKTFTEDIWKNSIIVFTYADRIEDVEKFNKTLKERTQLIRETITDSGVSNDIAIKIPSVAISNIKDFTVDGERWLSELYTVITERISQEGFEQFLLANIPRIEYTKEAIQSKSLQFSAYYLPNRKNDSNDNQTKKQVTKIYIDNSQSKRILKAAKKIGFWDKVERMIESINNLTGAKTDKVENNARRKTSRSALIKELQKRCIFVNAESGIANERFLIIRTDNNPWIVRKGNLLDWSNDNFLSIQETSDVEIKKYKNGDSFFDSLMSLFTQTISEMGSKEVKKMMAKRFDIQWKHINAIGK